MQAILLREGREVGTEANIDNQTKIIIIKRYKHSGLLPGL